MSKEILKPCPFCGGKAVVGWQVMSGDKIWHIECQSVECSTSECYRKTRKEAIAAWNARPIEDALNKRIAELEAVLSEAVKLYGKPGGPWNVPGDPGGWISRAKEALKGKITN